METMNPSARLVSTRVYYGCTYRRRRKSTDDESGFAVLRRARRRLTRRKPWSPS